MKKPEVNKEPFDSDPCPDCEEATIWVKTVLCNLTDKTKCIEESKRRKCLSKVKETCSHKSIVNICKKCGCIE